MTNSNTMDVRVFQSKDKAAATNKASRILGLVRKGNMSVDVAKTHAQYDVELSKVLSFDAIDVAATGGGRKRGNGKSTTKGSAVSKASRLTSQYREGKLTVEDLQKALDNDELLAAVTTLEKLTAAPRYVTIKIEAPADAASDDDEDDDFEDEDSDDE